VPFVRKSSHFREGGTIVDGVVDAFVRIAHQKPSVSRMSPMHAFVIYVITYCKVEREFLYDLIVSDTQEWYFYWRLNELLDDSDISLQRAAALGFRNSLIQGILQVL